MLLDLENATKVTREVDKDGMLMILLLYDFLKNS